MNWVKVGSWLSVAYIVTLGAGVALLGNYQLLDLTPSTHLTLNTLGDALAGVFAPLAFLWLFVATMVQSQELALQRKELELNRAVSTEQATEAKRTAQFIGAQTELLEQDAHRRRQEAVERELDAKVDALGAFTRQEVQDFMSVMSDGGAQHRLKICDVPLQRHRDLIGWSAALFAWIRKAETLERNRVLTGLHGIDTYIAYVWAERVREIYAMDPLTAEAKHYLSEAALNIAIERLINLPLREAPGFTLNELRRRFEVPSTMTSHTTPVL